MFSGLLISIVLTVMSFVLRINMIYIELLGKTHIYLGLIPIVLTCLIVLFDRIMKKKLSIHLFQFKIFMEYKMLS